MDPAIVESRMREYDLDLLGAKKWIAAAIDIEEPEKERMGQLAIHQEKGSDPHFRDADFGGKAGCLLPFCSFNAAGVQESGLSVIAAIDGENSQTGLIDVLGDICKETRKILAVPVTIGIEIIPPSFAGSAIPIRRRLILWATRPLWGAGAPSISTIWSRWSRGKLEFDGKTEAELGVAIKFGTKERIEASVAQIMERLNDAKGVHFRQQQAYMLSVAKFYDPAAAAV